MKDFNLLSIFMILMLGMSFTACSDDDEDGGNGGSASGVNNPLLNEGNMLLTSISRSNEYNADDPDIYKYSYDEKLRPYKAEENDEISFTIDYDKGKIIDWDYGSASNLSVSFNSKGYITKVNGSWDYTEDGERENGSMEFIASYDKDGHLTEVATNEEFHYEDGSEKEVSKITFEWKNGCLMSIRDNSVYDDEESTSTRTFTYGDQKNKFRQFPGILSADGGEFFAVGLFGVGPELLPITQQEVEKEGPHEDISTGSATYTLNANGSIDTENWTNQGGYDGSIWKFVFGYTASNAISASKTRSSDVQPWMTSADKAKKVKDFMSKLPFMSKRRHGK